MSDKIKPHHLERKAILYIRQSSAYQVSHNLESQKLQYAMQQRLQQLGWREINASLEALRRFHPRGPTLPASETLGSAGAVGRSLGGR